MITAVELRPLKTADLDAIEIVERASYPTPWSRSMFAGELAKPSGICLGAFQGEDMLGYLIVARYVDAWHVMNVAVDPAWRGRGVARSMLERLFALTDGDSERGYTLEVRVSNHTAIHLYESLGFVATGVRRGYYTDNREDALIMWRDPDPGVILGIETSCDETAAAVVTQDGAVLANVISSQAEVHAPYGGVVPEVASRRHLDLVVPVIEQALDEAGIGLRDLDAVAVTEGPGLIGALLVGLSAAKAIAFARGLPLVPVDHLHGHLAALYLQPQPLEPPFLALLASGGHTLVLEVTDHRGYRAIGGTLDDAAGEAFDKGARLLGLGYPGGARLERLAAEGDPAAYAFPAGMLGRPGYDLSFSGLKTALRYALAGDHGLSPADLAASYQAAIVRSLVERTAAAVIDTGATTLAVVGGVARNSALRDAFAERCRDLGVKLALVPPELCSDNAAMIASAARYTDAIDFPGYLGRDAYATVA